MFTSYADSNNYKYVKKEDIANLPSEVVINKYRILGLSHPDLDNYVELDDGVLFFDNYLRISTSNIPYYQSVLIVPINWRAGKLEFVKSNIRNILRPRPIVGNYIDVSINTKLKDVDSYSIYGDIGNLGNNVIPSVVSYLNGNKLDFTIEVYDGYLTCYRLFSYMKPSDISNAIVHVENIIKRLGGSS